MDTTIACAHLAEQPDLDTLYILDSHLHMTDGFVQCAVCGATYLVEMVDTAKGSSLFRVSSLSPTAVEKTIRSLQKGSCDINRARNEVSSVASDASELPFMLLMHNGQFTRTVPLPEHAIPKHSWRELPCDGSLLRAVMQGNPGF